MVRLEILVAEWRLADFAPLIPLVIPRYASNEKHIFIAQL